MKVIYIDIHLFISNKLKVIYNFITVVNNSSENSLCW